MSKDKKPKNPVSEEGRSRILRGGGWFRSADDMRSSYRNRSTPVYRDVYGGFRIVRNIPKEEKKNE